MKILWITNHFMPDIAQALNINKPISGSWLVDSARVLSSNSNIELFVACPSKESHRSYKINNITYYSIKASKKDIFIGPSKKFSKRCMELVMDLEPDIIHMHGSEFGYGLAFTSQRQVPVVLSIQGLISEINKKELFFSGIDFNKGIKSLLPRNLMKFLPIYLKYTRNKLRAISEIEQIKQCKYIIGRTDWDRCHCYFINPQANYFSIQETIRSSFFKSDWNIDNIKRNNIFCAGGFGNPLKGFHLILESIKILKREIPNISVKVVGNDLRQLKFPSGYNKYLIKKITSLELWNNIKFLGSLTDEEMAHEFSVTHVYVMGSSIENSSNTLGEAICVGTPSVVSYVGGIPSLVSEGKEALFYRFGDREQLAWKIKSILEDDDLALRLSLNAKVRSKVQYDFNKTTNKLIQYYEKIIVEHENKT